MHIMVNHISAHNSVPYRIIWDLCYISKTNNNKVLPFKLEYRAYTLLLDAITGNAVEPYLLRSHPIY